MNKIISISVLAVVLLTGCSKTYSVDELVKDRGKRAEVLQKCLTGTYKPDSKNCQNAAEAELKSAFNSINSVN